MVSLISRRSATSRPPRAESYESIRISRNRAYWLAVAAWPVAFVGIADAVVEKANEGYVPPVVLTIDANQHVAKSEIGTPKVLLAKDAVIESELARYMRERFTLDRAFREDHLTYVRLHSAADVEAQFEREMDPRNRENPYYGMPADAVRRVKDLRVRIIDKVEQKAEVNFSTFVDNGDTPHYTYWHVRCRYDFIKQALKPADRYVNGDGFVVTAFEPDTEPGPSAQ
jgi:type IV secretory pathway component VirB8